MRRIGRPVLFFLAVCRLSCEASQAVSSAVVTMNCEKWQLMLEIGHPMSMAIDISVNMIIMSIERRWCFEDRDFG